MNDSESNDELTRIIDHNRYKEHMIHCDEMRVTQRDLLLINDNKINNKWAEYTFKYCHLFDKHIKTETFTRGSNK